MVWGEARGVKLFQSTLPVRGATDGRMYSRTDAKISIHAPRKGSDEVVGDIRPVNDISIHAPRKGSDPLCC